jgi:autoinducer 2-degrading protein
MIVRVVQMHFKKECIEEFQDMFEQIKEGIRSQPGCELLELYQDKVDPQRFYTYSYWKDELSLNNYRHSQLFSEIWPKTKAMFDEKPVAHSLNKIHSLL